MPETTSNVEMAHRIHEQGHKGGGSGSRREQRLEIPGPRIGILAVTFGILAVASYCIATYPRA
jgi:hypothetical protein